jgi:hypothetical protein
LTFTATNAAGTSPPQAFTLTVIESPRITSPAPQTFTVGTPVGFTVTTTGFPKPTILLTGALPGGVTFVDNGDGMAALRGTPAAGTGGTYTFEIRAANGRPPDAVQNVTLTVLEAPAITSPNATTFTAGSAASFTVTTSGFPRPTISMGGGFGLRGVTFVDNRDGTATLSATSSAGPAGTYALTFTASNALGQAIQAFTLTVVNTPAGANVPVDLGGGTSVAGGVSILFPTVTTTGTTTVTYPSSCPTLPSAFTVGTPSVCYDVTTTAAYSTPPPVQVCINYSGISFGSGPIVLLHYQAGGWADVTTSVDTAAQIVCGGVSSFSPFVVARGVVAPPSIAKAFGAAAINLFGATRLTFTLTNPNATTLHAVNFTDPLPRGLIVAIPSGRTGSCGGVFTAVPASRSISLVGGTLAPGASCNVSVNVIGITVGPKTNTTGYVTSTEGGRGNAASAQISVQSPAGQPNCQGLLESTLTRIFGGLPRAADALEVGSELELVEAIRAACHR